MVHRRNVKSVLDDKKIRLQAIRTVIRNHNIIDGDALELGDLITECIDISEETSLLYHSCLCPNNCHVCMGIKLSC